MRRRTARLLAALAAASVLAGCGSSSPSKTPARTTTQATAATGKPAYISAADAVCRQFRGSLTQFRAQSAALSRLGDQRKAFALAANLMRRIQTLEQTELSRLKALPLPAGDHTAATNYLQQAGLSVALVGHLADTFTKGDRAAILATERGGSQLAATVKGLAQGYGFKVCGDPSVGNGL